VIRAAAPTAGRLVATGALLLAALAAQAQTVSPAPPARVIVTLKDDAPLLREQPLALDASASEAHAAVQRRADRLAARAGVALESGSAISARSQVLTARGVDAATLARRLAADPEVLHVAVDQRRRALYVPSDLLYARGPASGRGPDAGQWYLRAPTAELRSAVNAEAAWDRITGSPGVVVAVLDTGVLADHLDLAGAVLPGYDMVSDPATANDGNGRDADASDPGDWITPAENANRGGDFYNCGAADSSWHGTKIAGVVGAIADNGQGMAGTAFGVKILPVRVLGKCGGYDSDIQAGMRWAAGLAVPGLPLNPNPARVLNLSLGGSGACTAATGYPAVIAELQAAGAVVVVAAGNSVGHAAELPANCDGVIAVAGLRHAGTKVGFSDLGPAITLAAPAGNCVNLGAGEPCLYPILSSSNSGTQRPNAGGSIWTDAYNYSVGTSFAAPIVAGSAALMLSARPQLLPQEVRTMLQSSARAFPTSGAGNDENGQPIPMCRTPDGTDQLQCYCSAGLCGAGMLDAAAAVAAAGGTLARFTVAPATPLAGDVLQLDAGASLPAAGRGIAGYEWTVLDDPGVLAVAPGTVGGSRIELATVAAGSLLVNLTVIDDAGQRASIQQRISVGAVVAAVPEGGGGGGGAASLIWVALLGLAVAALLHIRATEGATHPGSRPQ